MITPALGQRYLGPSGRIWTVEHVMPGARRIHLVEHASAGACGVVIDMGALERMVPLPALEVPASAPTGETPAAGSDLAAAEPVAAEL